MTSSPRRTARVFLPQNCRRRRSIFTLFDVIEATTAPAAEVGIGRERDTDPWMTKRIEIDIEVKKRILFDNQNK